MNYEDASLTDTDYISNTLFTDSSTIIHFLPSQIDISFTSINYDLSIIPSISNDAALLIIDPMFLGSVTLSKQTKFKLFLPLINFP